MTDLEKRLRESAVYSDDEALRIEAADALAALTKQVEERDDNHDKLQRVRQWAEAYPIDIFFPVSADDLKRADALLRASGISMSAMHGHWARHIVSGIANIVGSDILIGSAAKDGAARERLHAAFNNDSPTSRIIQNALRKLDSSMAPAPEDE